MRKTKNTVLQRKYQVIFLHMEGYTNTDIADIVALNRKTVGIYISQFIAGGVEGLIPKKPPGRPGFLTKEQKQTLYITITLVCWIYLIASI